MAKNFNQGRAERQFKQKLRTMISSAAHTQNIADQAMDLAGQFMTEDAISNSDAYRVIENVSCVCEEAMQVLIEELKRERAFTRDFRMIRMTSNGKRLRNYK